MPEAVEIEDWQRIAIGYRNLAPQAGTEASRIMLENLAREAEEIAEGMIAGQAARRS
jgi:ribosomal protein S7